MPKYDIVVVGAGNAGMSAALQCQLAGKKTLLIEKHNVPGGAATSFVRGRFELILIHTLLNTKILAVKKIFQIK